MKLLDNDFFIKNTNVKVDYKNKLSIKVNPKGFQTFESLYLKTKDGTIITLPPFLQRYLQEQIWKHNNYGKSKSYISSSIVATSMFESFIFVSVDVLIKELENKIISFDEAGLLEQKKHATECLESLEKQKAKGAKYAQIDGQSRTKLSIVPYINNEFAIDTSIPVNVFNPDTNEYLGYYQLKGKYCDDIPYTIQRYILATPVYSVCIEGGSLDMIVNSLISKQEGEKFTAWQKAYHGQVLSIMGTYINNVLKAPLRDFWEAHVTQNNIYKSEKAGLEMFMAKLSYYFYSKSFPDVHTLKNVLDGKNESPTQNLFTKSVEYLNEVVTYYGTLTAKDSVKLKPVTIMNYCLFRWHLEYAHKREQHFSVYNLPHSLVINNTNLFVHAFLDMDKKLSAKKWNNNGTEVLNTYSYEEVVVNGNTIIDRKNGGYVAGNNNEADYLIEWRLTNLSNYFNQSKVNELINSAVLKYDLNEMPSYEAVEVFNDFEDTRGNNIDHRTSKKENHRGHKTSKWNNGDNSLSNLKPQPASDNLQYNKKNLITTK